MSRRVIGLLLCLATLTVVGVGCGNDEDLGDLAEGEAFDLGDLRYNVLFTRFLNANDVEDRDYLTGQKPAPKGQDYLAVFLQIKNEGSEDLSVPASSEFGLTDTTDAKFAPLSSASLFGLQFGASIPPGDQVPVPDSVGFVGTAKGSMILFLVPEGVTENRPLKLDVMSGDQEASVKLDI